jgi:hypothetical protein
MTAAHALPFPDELDPIREAMRGAPLVRRLTAEQHAELAHDLAAIAAGSARLVAHDDVPTVLEEIARSRGA